MEAAVETTMVWDDAAARAVADGNQVKEDSKLRVSFYMGSILNREKSDAANRPIYDNMEKIKIVTPADTLNVIDREVRPGDIQRFPAHYERFKKGLAEHVQSGTPLAHWTRITEGQRKELEAANVFTVEDLAGMSDGLAMRFMGNHSLRQAARDFIEAAKGNAPLTQMRAELESRDAENATLKAQMAEMMKALQALQAKEAAPPQQQHGKGR